MDSGAGGTKQDRAMTEEEYLEKIGKLEDQINDLKDEATDYEEKIDRLETDVEELESMLQSALEKSDFNIDSMNDSRKYDLIKEHWKNITLDHIDGMLKIIGV